MTDGTSQGLFIVVAIVIFGIFVVLAYILFEDTLSPAMASIFMDASEMADDSINMKKMEGKNLLINGSKLLEGPKMGYSGVEAHGKKPGVEGREYVAFANVSQLFDTFGEGTYTISFDLKATQVGDIYVYTQTGSTQYLLGKYVQVTEPDTWVRYAIQVPVTELDPSHENYHASVSNLSFYGGYGTGRSPSVKNVKVEKGAVDGIPEYEEAPITLRYKKK